jgi:hypothetical protein
MFSTEGEHFSTRGEMFATEGFVHDPRTLASKRATEGNVFN